MKLYIAIAGEKEKDIILSLKEALEDNEFLKEDNMFIPLLNGNIDFQ